jgi:conjugative relaxase-like TrwC/TraI family protein
LGSGAQATHGLALGVSVKDFWRVRCPKRWGSTCLSRYGGIFEGPRRAGLRRRVVRRVRAMMGLAKLSAGEGYTYLTRQVAALDGTDRGPRSLEAYYSAKGESPGRWLGFGLEGLGIAEGSPVAEAQMRHLFGSGLHPDTGAPLGRPFKVYPPRAGFRDAVTTAYQVYNLEVGRSAKAPVPDQERARIRSQVARRLFAERHGRAPADARELSGFIAQESRPRRVAVAGFDLTFSPVKSVSVLWALGSRDVARAVEAAHRAAVEDTMGWLEREVAFTRSGVGGVRQVAVAGLVATAFTHRDSRAGDPDLHTHVAVSNKVRTLAGEGARWLALDGRVLYKAKVAASERYNTRLEAELVDRLGVRFVERGMSDGRRPIREIDGVEPLLISGWSMRRREINDRRSVLARRFQADHGRPPTPVEALALAQQATLETRDAKHAPRSEAEQRRSWRREAAGWLFGERHVDAMVAGVMHPRHGVEASAQPSVAELAERAIETVSGARATWQVWHVRAEAERLARTVGLGRAELDPFVERVVEHALGVCSVRLGARDPVAEPPALLRPDGSSVYDVAGSTSYTSARILAAEERILAAAKRGDGRRVRPELVTAVFDQLSAQHGGLATEQAALVGELSTSGRRVQLALAPAGSGKTRAMRALVQVWRAAGGDAIALAPSASAADEIGVVAGLDADTLAKLVHAARSQPEEQWPAWMRRIGPASLVIIDEAGMAGTADLAAAVDFVLSRGGSVRLVGDDHQLSSVAAGGVLRDLDHHVGAVRLTHLHRFTDPHEAAATLALRAGDVAALGYYADHGRIHVGDLATATERAYQAWAADRAVGHDSVLLAPTRDLVRELNDRARHDRLAGRDAGPEVTLADGTHAGVGDVIVTRHNDRRLRYGSGNWVRNGDRWTVVGVSPGGAIRARHQRRGTCRELPPAYVAEHVQLGYATTVHAAQGITADICHTVMTGTESRQLLYVAMTRGRAGNHAHLAAAPDGDPHTALDPETMAPSTAIELLARMLGRDESQQSATTTQLLLHDPATRLHDAVLRYQDALGYAAAEALGPDWLASLDRFAEALVPGLTGCPAYPTLASRLALTALSGRNTAVDLLHAWEQGGLESAHDAAAVLDYRLADRATGGPLPWLPGVPDNLAASEWGEYLEQRARLVADLADQVRASVRGAAPAGAIAVAEALGAELAVWRAAYGVPDSDTRPAGTRVQGVGSAYQKSLNARLPRPASAGGDWTRVLPAEVLRDPRRGALFDHLDELDAAGVDVPAAVEEALAVRPLPTEVPADALRWRLAGLVPPPPSSTQPERSPEPPSDPVLHRTTLLADAPRQATDYERLSEGYSMDRGRGIGPSR